MNLRRPTIDERGESLLELLIAVVIMGLAVVAIMAGISTSVLMSDIHRKQATAGAAVHTYSEAIENYVAGGGYTNCATASSGGSGPYGTTAVNFAAPAGYSVTVGAAMSWTGSGWGACTSDSGYQKVTVRVVGGSRAGERIDLILRKPCRTSDGICS
jgi:type II secretory pathway pseudopilin PulG